MNTAKKTFMASIMAVSFAFSPVFMSGKDAGAQETQYVTIKGSDTMVHLVSAWAEAFMTAHPDVEISVTGGGSGTGFAALLNKTTDICAASRQIKDQELKLASEKNINPKEIVVARDGIAVVVNPANPLNSLSIEQLGKIYTGAYTNWKQVGGPDAEIMVLSRESSSGTYVFFQEHVLKMKDYTPKARLMPATSSIIQTVETDKWAIGYVGLGYAVEAGSKIKALSVSDGGKTVAPSEATVKSGEYSISRPLYLYTNGEPTGAIKRIIDFCLGSEGQKIVRETGYITVSN